MIYYLTIDRQTGRPLESLPGMAHLRASRTEAVRNVEQCGGRFLLAVVALEIDERRMKRLALKDKPKARRRAKPTA